MQQIYLDSNATTRIDERVADAMASVQRDLPGNPASQHWAGQRARRRLEEARESVAELLGARTGREADRLLFTSGGTEANNLAILGLAGTGDVVLSKVEHPSVLECKVPLLAAGCRVSELPVNAAGIVDHSALRAILGPQTRVVSVQLANSETGVMQPIKQFAEICGAAGVPLHTDAIQLVGKAPVSFAELGVSALSVSAHKFHGPVGIGGLLLRGDLPLQPIQHGGFQQSGLRPGTESVVLAAGMARALELWQREAVERQTQLRRSRDTLERLLLSAEPELRVHGQQSPRTPQTSNIAFLGVDRQQMLLALDQAGIACSTGSACASGSSEPSPVLLAMGLPEEQINSALRFSVDAFTTTREVEQAAHRILFVYRDLRRQSKARKSSSVARQQGSKTI